MQPYEIVHSVLDSYRGLPVRLREITGKAASIYQMHGYERQTDNPLMHGRRCAVDDYMEFCELYEAGEPGAGMMLANRVHAEQMERFTERNLMATGRDLLCGVVVEASDVERWLAANDPDKATKNEVTLFIRECDEALEAIYEAKSRAVSRLKYIELERRAAR